jgi:tetratricopeptide (TPR) repeat protein
MIHSNGLRRNLRSGRLALGAALVLGTVLAAPFAAAPAVAATKPAPAIKISLSKTFMPLYTNMAKAVEAAKVRPDVVAARTNVTTAQTALQQARGAARTQAQANVDAALAALSGLVAAEKAQLDALFTAAAASPDDNYGAGTQAIALGDLIKDTRIQRRGLEAMLNSGKVAPADAPRLQYFLGQFAFDMKEYAAARTALQSAISAGFVENDIDGLLAEAYFADNQAQQGLVVLKQAIDRRNTTPTKAPAGWYRRGLGVAYKSQLLDQAIAYSMGLVQAYPTNDNWAGAITVVREIGKFAPQESLDLMRLMGRTNSYAEERDYIEYIQAADARRLPGEVIKVLDAGIAAGKLRANDQFVAEARTIASGRVGPDRASLPALERDARAPGATAATLSGAADAFLSYGDLAKAEELYNLAMTKPGADVPRLLTRLGISQFDQGNYAAAQANFAKVTGPRQSIAQLWALYAGIKARPAA